jgi:hypothetical protein
VTAIATQTFVIERRPGRHRALAAAVPGSAYLELGLAHAGAAVLSPWDVDDVTAVPAAKVAFVTRLHGLVMGATLTTLQRRVLAIAVRDVYARAADAEGTPSASFLRAVLTDLARQERADPLGARATVGAYDDLVARMGDICAGGRFGHVLDRPTHVDLTGAPLVVFATGAVPAQIAAAVVLTITEYAGRLSGRRGGPRIALLADAAGPAPVAPAQEHYPPAFARDSLLNGLHESYLRRRIRAGEERAIAYLHAMSDVAYFLHPPTNRSIHTRSSS